MTMTSTQLSSSIVGCTFWLQKLRRSGIAVAKFDSRTSCGDIYVSSLKQLNAGTTLSLKDCGRTVCYARGRTQKDRTASPQGKRVATRRTSSPRRTRPSLGSDHDNLSDKGAASVVGKDINDDRQDTAKPEAPGTENAHQGQSSGLNGKVLNGKPPDSNEADRHFTVSAEGAVVENGVPSPPPAAPPPVPAAETAADAADAPAAAPSPAAAAAPLAASAAGPAAAPSAASAAGPVVTPSATSAAGPAAAPSAAASPAATVALSNGPAQLEGQAPAAAKPHISIPDLMLMIKDAEKNILILNRVRTRTLEELDQSRRENETLQGQVKVLEIRIEESEAKLHLAAQVRAKNQLLEEQLQVMQARLDEAVGAVAELKGWQEEQARALQASQASSEAKAAQLAGLDAERAGLLARVQELQERAAEQERAEAAARESARAESGELQERVGELEAQLRDASSSSSSDGSGSSSRGSSGVGEEEEREAREGERAALQKEVEGLRGMLAASQAAASREARDAQQQQQVVALQERLGVAEEARAAESAALQEQVQDACAQLAGVERQKEEEVRSAREEAAAARRQDVELQERARALEAQVAGLEDMVETSAALEAQMVATQARSMEQDSEVQQSLALAAERVRLLEASLAEADAERRVWGRVEQEKAALEEQVAALQLRLVESDDTIRAQLELYQAEVESFQENLERLGPDSPGGAAGAKAGAGAGARGAGAAPAALVPAEEVPVGEMPWDFWSNLLLRLDELMLGKHLTHEQGLELRLMAWHRKVAIRDAYVAVQEASDLRAAGALKELIKAKLRPGMHIVHIAAEMAPVAKVGGLGDVVTGLGRALQKKGHLVEIILPKYDCMDYSRIKGLKVMDFDLESYFDGQLHKSKIWRGIVEGLPVYFVEPLHPGRFFWRGAFYGEADDFRRFTFFCRAALEFLLKAGKRPDIIHGHDWQTAAVAPLYWDVYLPLGMNSARVAFTCHNFEYQGTDAPAALAACGLDVASHFRPDRMQDNFMLDRINLLKGAFVYSNLITTVSPTYALEVRGPEGGRGLHPTLAQHHSKFHGVLNGIDDDAWDPMSDPLLEYQFNADDLSGKAANKAALKLRLGLASSSSSSSSPSGIDEDERPLVGCITRLVPQKGVHLIRHAIFHTLEKGGQFVLLGSSPVPEIQREFEAIAKKFERHAHIRLVLKYDEGLSHLIYAGTDLLVIPSLFEPCGLTQLIAMRYGSIPVVRKTGGLADSVFDVDDSSIPPQKKNGYSFSAADEQGLSYALDRAFAHYFERPDTWQELVSRAMNMDFSWKESSERYIELYQKARDATAV